MGWNSFLGFTGSWVSLVSMALGSSVSGGVLVFCWVLLSWVACDWFLLCEVVFSFFSVFSWDSLGGGGKGSVGGFGGRAIFS